MKVKVNERSIIAKKLKMQLDVEVSPPVKTSQTCNLYTEKSRMIFVPIGLPMPFPK